MSLAFSNEKIDKRNMIPYSLDWEQLLEVGTKLHYITSESEFQIDVLILNFDFLFAGSMTEQPWVRFRMSDGVNLLAGSQNVSLNVTAQGALSNP